MEPCEFEGIISSQPPFRYLLKPGISRQRNCHNNNHPHRHGVPKPRIMKYIAPYLRPNLDRYNGQCAARERIRCGIRSKGIRSEEHTSELQSRLHLVCRLLLEKKKHNTKT